MNDGDEIPTAISTFSWSLGSRKSMLTFADIDRNWKYKIAAAKIERICISRLRLDADAIQTVVLLLFYQNLIPKPSNIHFRVCPSQRKYVQHCEMSRDPVSGSPNGHPQTGSTYLLSPDRNFISKPRTMFSIMPDSTELRLTV
jgi:hypothetical protein